MMHLSSAVFVVAVTALIQNLPEAHAISLDREPSLESVKNSIRGHSYLSPDDAADDDAHADQLPNERDLGRTKRRYGGGKDKQCGDFCGDKDFAYIHLRGAYFFGEFNDNSTDTVPIETVGALNTTKEGATLRIFEDNLPGTIKYFDHDDKYPHKSDITGVLTGSCTVLGLSPGNSSGVEFCEDCLAHCTICVSYNGLCCDSHGYGWDKNDKCSSFGGFATITGDLIFEVEQEIGVNGRLQSIPLTEGGLVGLDGFGVVTGTAGELGPSKNGGLGIITYDAFSGDGDTYNIGLKIPFSDKASCKLQDSLFG